MILPRVTPMPLARFDQPFERPDWVFEPKLDGFRAIAYVEDGTCRLVTPNRQAFRTFEALALAIGRQLSGRSAILDGAIGRALSWDRSIGWMASASKGLATA